ncbi:hypothetical protein SAMN05421881_11561 [Nitrosomonas halophila]|uniref:Uncharacterized protein n=1 Tax=Nitrosomonas halophila TaxID=44576 RepID=A0A1H3QFB1_9PROT|nr:hypothetical protein SAMN05421881_11561 [Nitrosomonas halophila]
MGRSSRICPIARQNSTHVNVTTQSFVYIGVHSWFLQQGNLPGIGQHRSGLLRCKAPRKDGGKLANVVGDARAPSNTLGHCQHTGTSGKNPARKHTPQPKPRMDANNESHFDCVSAVIWPVIAHLPHRMAKFDPCERYHSIIRVYSCAFVVSPARQHRMVTAPTQPPSWRGPQGRGHPEPSAPSHLCPDRLLAQVFMVHKCTLPGFRAPLKIHISSQYVVVHKKCLLAYSHMQGDIFCSRLVLFKTLNFGSSAESVGDIRFR